MIKKNHSPLIIVAVFLAITAFLIISDFSKSNLANIKTVVVAGQNIKVDLAITDVEKERGLSGRSSLAQNKGMLFIFDHPDTYYFWMKNMNFAIDMIWIGEDMRVVYIKKNAVPESYLDTYGPSSDAKYVLEVRSGFSETNNLKEGDKVEFLTH